MAREFTEVADGVHVLNYRYLNQNIGVIVGRDEVMDRVVRRKFELHPQLRTLLLATGDEPIAEDGPNNDTYWGVGRDGSGQNKLGRIIERIRAELRAGQVL